MTNRNYPETMSEEYKEKCICNEGIHDEKRIDCACKCHQEQPNDK